MKNKFALFLKDLNDKESIFDELDDFTGNSKGKYKSLSGGSSTLTVLFHQNISDAVIKAITCQLKTKVSFELELHYSNIRNDLLKELIKNIDEHSTIEPDAGFSKEDMANHFIAEIYDPLLSLGKEISDKVNPILSMNNDNAFIKNPSPS